MKKLFTVLICLLVTVCAAMTAASCTVLHVVSGTMEELAGTYKLTCYKVTPEENEENAGQSYEERTQDYIAQKGIEAYLIVTGESVGYYYYKEAQADWWAETVSISYNYETDGEGNDTDQIRSISFDNQVHSMTYVPGHGRETAGFNKNNHTLNYTQRAYDGKYIHVPNTTAVVYTRESTDVTRAYAEGKIGKSFNIPRFELKKLNGLLDYARLFHNDAASDSLDPFIYCHVMFDNVTLEATVYYALKSDYAAGKRGDELKRVEYNTATLTEDEENVYLDLKFRDIDGNPVFTIRKGTVSTYVEGTTFYYRYDPDLNEYFISEEGDYTVRTNDALCPHGEYDSLDSVFDGAIAWYEQKLQLQ